MSSNTGLIDSLTLRQILIERYSKGEAKRLLKHLKRLSRDVKKKIVSDYDRVRAVALAKQVEKIAATYLNEYGADMISGLKDFGEAEAVFAREALLSLTAAETIAPASLRQIKAVITKVPMKLIGGKKTQSITIDKAINNFSRNKSKEIGQFIRDGAILGRTTDEIVEDITNVVGNQFENQAATLVKTTTGHMGEQARKETYDANDDVVDGWEFTATLDSRTSITCSSLDGNIYPLNTGPLPKLHWNCRSVAVPKVNPKYDLGSEIVGERASIDGAVPANRTYGGWLKGQNKGVQIEVLGEERAKLFRSGKLSIGKFTDDSGKVYTLPELKKLNPIAFGEAVKRKVVKTKATKKVAANISSPFKNKVDAATDVWNDKSTKGSRSSFISLMAVNQTITLTNIKGKRGGAWARGGDQINIPVSYKSGNLYDQSVWRHEMGHIIDAKIGGNLENKAYFSSTIAFRDALKLDSNSLIDASKNTSFDKALPSRWAANKLYQQTSTKASWVKAQKALDSDIAYSGEISSMSINKQIKALDRFASKNNIDFDKFTKLMEESSNMLPNGLSKATGDQLSTLYKSMVALKHKQADGFLKLTMKSDAFDQTVKNWKKDGSFAGLSDLVGSSTKNIVADHDSGFYYGHSGKYYRQAEYLKFTESFANLNALYGHRNKYWWDIVKMLAPEMAKVYEGILK